MLSIMLGALLLAAGLFTGVLFADVFLPRREAFERWVVGLGCGVALLLCLAYGAALVGALQLTPVGIVAVGAALLWRRLKAPVRPAALAPEPVWAWMAFLVLLTLAWGWFSYPTWMRELPQGWDAAFHVSATEIIRTQRRLPATWAPYEPFDKFNYPAALHSVLAIIGRIAEVPSSRIFTAAFVVVAGLTLLLVFATASRLGEHKGAGALAVILYAFTEGWGTLTSHAVWGGLPSLAGLLLMWVMMLASVEPDRGGVVVCTLCAVALVLLHHLSFAMFGSVVFLLVCLEGVSERRLSGPTRTVFIATIVAGLTAGTLVILRPSGHFGIAEAFHFDRESMITLPKLVDVVGWPMLLLGGGGLLWTLASSRDSPAMRTLGGWTVGFLAFWVSWDIVYRVVEFFITRRNFTAFTPSRGLTDAAAFLSALGGIFLWRLVRRLPAPAVWIGAALALALAGDWSGEKTRIADASRDAGELIQAGAFCRQVREVTPPDAVLFARNAGNAGIWLPYLCDRETNYFPDPGYATSAYREGKMQQTDGRAFARFVRQDRARPVYVVTSHSPSQSQPVLRVGSWSLVEVP